MSDDTVVNLPELVPFEPTPSMRMAKAAFWAKYAEMPMADDKSITQTMAIQLSNNTTISRWWKKPGFEAWFKNKSEWDQRIQYLAVLSLETAEELLTNPRVPAAAKVSLIKTINELANKAPAKSKEIKLVDEGVGKMTKEQLDAFIVEQTKKLSLASGEEG